MFSRALNKKKRKYAIRYEHLLYCIHLRFCHICSRASANSWLVTSSESWNLRNPSPPWPVRYIRMLLPSSVSNCFERGVSGGNRPVNSRTKFSTVTWTKSNRKLKTKTKRVRDGWGGGVYLVTSEIDFDVIAVNVELLIGVVEHGRRTGITGIAGHVVGHHQYYLTGKREFFFSIIIYVRYTYIYDRSKLTCPVCPDVWHFGKWTGRWPHVGNWTRTSRYPPVPPNCSSGWPGRRKIRRDYARAASMSLL